MLRRDLEYSPEMSRRPKLVLIPDHSVPAGYKLALYCDQGSVQPVRVFGSLSIYFTPQVKTNILYNPLTMICQ
jgi:hypothetical protein